MLLLWGEYAQGVGIAAELRLHYRTNPYHSESERSKLCERLIKWLLESLAV